MESQQVETQKSVKGNTVWSISAPTPMWAIWAFRIEFWFNKFFLIWVSSVDIFTAGQIKLIVATCIAIDGFIWGIARSIGVQKPEDKQ